MKYIETYIVKKIDISNFNISLPKFYNNYKNETKLAYLLLNYIYYKKYNSFLNINFISKDKNNKPIFLKNNLYFNISHSKNYVACSLSTTNIGIDLEEDRVIKDKTLNKITHFNDKNISSIKIWNIKEAYSKYLGIGLKLNFSKISIEEIKTNVNLNSSIYNIENKILYFSLCYDIDKNICNNIYFTNQQKLTDFYSKFYNKEAN